MATQWTDAEFGYEDVILDDAAFHRCRFHDSRLIYSGGALPTFDETEIGERAVFILDGAALHTLELLSLLLHRAGRGGAETVEGVIHDLRRGAFEPDGTR